MPYNEKAEHTAPSAVNRIIIISDEYQERKMKFSFIIIYLFVVYIL